MSENDSKQGSSQPNPDIPDNAQDLTIFVQNLLEQMVIPSLPNLTFFSLLFSVLLFTIFSISFLLCLFMIRSDPLLSMSVSLCQQQRFHQMSSSIVGRIDEMGNRIDDLEKSIADLMQQVLSPISSSVLTVLDSWGIM